MGPPPGGAASCVDLPLWRNRPAPLDHGQQRVRRLQTPSDPLLREPLGKEWDAVGESLASYLRLDSRRSREQAGRPDLGPSLVAAQWRISGEVRALAPSIARRGRVLF